MSHKRFCQYSKPPANPQQECGPGAMMRAIARSRPATGLVFMQNRFYEPATGAVMDGQGTNPEPRRTRHVYAGLEMIQEYACGADGASPPIAGAWPCATGMPLVREFVHGGEGDQGGSLNGHLPNTLDDHGVHAQDRYPEVVAMIRHNPDTQDSWAYHYLHDALGSVVGIVDAGGTLVERYTYDPYGKPFIEYWEPEADEGAGAWLDTATAETAWSAPAGGMAYSRFGNRYMFTGHRYDAALGLYHTLFRTYSPLLGRWLQRDPIEYAAGSISLYEYVRGSPLGWFDPLGLDSIPASCPTEVESNDDEKCFVECKIRKLKALVAFRDANNLNWSVDHQRKLIDQVNRG